MTAVNIYEQWTFDELEGQGFAVFTPYKDRGVDCVVTNKGFQGRPQKIQIKGSRSFDLYAAAWHQFTRSSLEKSVSITDFWIFVSYRVGAKKGKLQPVFLVVPTNVLLERLTRYAVPSSGRYNLYFHWDNPEHLGMVVDARRRKGDSWPIASGDPRDYSDYDHNWPLISEAVGL